MTDTTRLSLPLLMPSQAQKHVTVNEALLRLDALSQLVLVSRSRTAPPTTVAEGDCYGVANGATDAWSGRDGEIAVHLNGGWDFVRPGRGWRAFIDDEGIVAVFDGAWSPLGGGGAVSPPSAAGPELRAIALDHALAAGPVSVTAALLPGGASVWGVTGRVIEPIGGAASFQLGVDGGENRYGSGIGTGAGSWLRGLTGAPLTYWSDTPLVLTAEGGDFDGTGVLRLVVYAVELPLPG